MSKLKRLAKIGLGMSSRQVAALLVTAAIGAGVAVSALAGQGAVATCLLALLLLAVPAGVMYLSRRLAGVNRNTDEAVRDLRILVDQLQRRVIAAIERERLLAGDRHLELTDALARAERLVGADRKSGGLTGQAAELLLREQNQQIEAMFQLFRQVRPRATMPTGDDLNPTDLLGLLTVATGRAPRLTVALGSGPATVWLGYALETTGGRLVAVDHDKDRADATRAMVAEHRLMTVEVQHAAAAPLTVEGRAVTWYDVDALDKLRDIDLLIVDGTTAPSAESLTAALYVLSGRLTEDAVVVVDEAPGRPAVPRQSGNFGWNAQRRVAGRWTTLTPAPRKAAPPSTAGGELLAGERGL